jgi:hypothetical protein
MVLNSSSPGQERAIEFARGGVFTEQDAKGVENSAVADVGDCREGQYHYPSIPPLLLGRLQWPRAQGLPWLCWCFLPDDTPPAADLWTTSGSWPLFSARSMAPERAVGILLVLGIE